MVELKTERLVLKKAEQKDIPELISGLGDIEVAKHMSNVPHPYTICDASNWVNRSRARCSHRQTC